MRRGAWFLGYDFFDSLENHQPEVRVRVALQARNEVDALAEGRLKLPPLETFKGWDGKRYPRNPSVFYEIVLS